MLYPFFASRLALLAVGLLTQIFIQPFMAKAAPLRLGGHAALDLWGAWDSGWYVSLATNGYARAAGADGYANWAFFPAYPLLSAGLARVTHLTVFEAMLLISNASFLAALFLLHRLARREFDSRTADIAVALLCAVPGSYVFSSAYTESLFLLAAVSGFLLLRTRRWLAAGACASLAVLTRNVGGGLLLPFVVEAAPRLLGQLPSRGPAATSWRRLAAEGLRVAGGLALPVLALAGFALFLDLRTGDPLAFITAQKGWGRTFGDPFTRPLRYLLHPSTLPQENDLLSFAFVWLSFGLIAALALMRRWSLLVLALFFALVPLTTGISSYQRYCLTMFPLFITAGRLLSTRPAAATATLVTLASVNGFMMVAWTLGLGLAQ